MRTISFVLAAVSLLGALGYFACGQGIVPTVPESDPWVGKYLRFSRYDSERRGQFGEAQPIEITKGPDGYSLSKPYEHWKFKEVKKGVLSDGKGGIGSIYLGTATFADGKQSRVLRAEFCYERFHLYAD